MKTRITEDQNQCLEREYEEESAQLQAYETAEEEENECLLEYQKRVRTFFRLARRFEREALLQAQNLRADQDHDLIRLLLQQVLGATTCALQKIQRYAEAGEFTRDEFSQLARAEEK